MAQNVNPGGTPTASGAAAVVKDDGKGGSASAGTSKVTKRLQQELMTLMTSGQKGISAFPEGDKLFAWVATVEGPQESVYAGDKFKLRLEFPAGYPYQPPKVKFTSPCFHPNVDNHGNICLDILKENWSALYDVRTLLLSIQNLLGDPNNDSPLNVLAANLWKDQPAFKAHLDQHYRDPKSEK